MSDDMKEKLDCMARRIRDIVDNEFGLLGRLTIVVGFKDDNGDVYAKGIGDAGIQWILHPIEPGLLLPKGQVEPIE